MARFAVRHWTALLVIVVVAAWTLLYLPSTPSWAVYQLKLAIDRRDGASAATYVNFPNVVRQAGYEMVQKKAGRDNLLGELVGKGAVDMFSKPVAAMVQSWAQHQVDDGARNLQMPGWAVAAAIVTLHRNGDTAYTRFTDARGRVWDIRMARNGDSGRWQIVEVRDLGQLIQQLQAESSGTSPAPPSP
jgi:Protein of unknown function (DUF2939)